MNEDKSADPEAVSSFNRRDFLKLSTTTVAGSIMIPLVPALAQGPQPKGKPGGYPAVDVVLLDSVREGTQVPFTYPDKSSPAVLLRLQQSAMGGVGPGNSIIAYSILCTHQGCTVSYRPERKLFICPCHWSSFDPAMAGQMVVGQACHPLPQIELRINAGMIQAVGVDGLIYGRQTNVS
jgi:arsenite oxidase small subunit